MGQAGTQPPLLREGHSSLAIAWWRRRAWRWSAWVILLVGVVVVLEAWPTAQLVEFAREKTAMLGAWGPVALGVAYVIAGLLFVPGTALTIAAGAVFGFWIGAGTVSIASTVTAVLAYGIAKHLARKRVRAWASRNPAVRVFQRAVTRGGWRIVVLLRLSPAIPFSLGSYVYGLTDLPFLPHLLASWLTMLPGICLYTYLGVIGGRAITTGGGGLSALEWFGAGLGLFATIAASVYLSRMAREALQEETS